MNEWFYGRDGQQTGPVSIDRLAQLLSSGEVKRGDPVWRPGMPDWVAASSVPELFRPPAPAVVDRASAPPLASITPSTYGTVPLPAASAQSRVGIASFAIAVIVIVMEVAGITVAAVSAGPRHVASPAAPPGIHLASTLPSARTTNSAGIGTMMAGLAIIVGLLLNVLGLVLGIVSLGHQGRRTLGVLGLIINAGILFLLGVFLIIGFVAK